jgi:UDP-N-acetyl-D-glucosamine/UDP-N-acetyl-D-galactosamine dehydrogenase
MKISERLQKRETALSVIGLGYVGLPIALEFARKMRVIGFDIKPDRVEMMKKGIDPSQELGSEAFEGCDIHFTSDPDDLREASFHIVAVPTPIDDTNMPDLSPLIKASESLGKVLKAGDTIVYESTVYPGATEEECVPVLEKFSGLKFPDDFKVGYSPERINPGDKVNTLTSVVKVVSGCDAESLEEIATVYEMVIKAGVHRASSIKVAEAAKIIENTQRDVNIGLMNELSIIFNRMGINTYDVLEAAGTKWNFLKFYPGLVGGHCIGVDPYYLAYKAKKLRYHPQIINSGRFVNDSMGFYVAKQTVKKIIAAGKPVQNSRVLIMGATFKEDVADIRNSKVVDVYRELLTYGVKVDLVDHHADSDEMMHEYGIQLLDTPGTGYDAVIIAVAHHEYKSLDEAWFRSVMSDQGIIVDIKGMYRNAIRETEYWSL